MNTQNDLIHCVYASSSTVPFDHDALKGLLALSRQNNASLDITGMLLYENGSFFQVLEGAWEKVARLFDKISLDLHHDHITKIIEEPIKKRSFAEWTMGYSDVTYSDLAKIDGLNNFFMQKHNFWEIESGRAQKLVEAFREGRWRDSLR